METLTSRRWNAWGAIALPYKDYSMDFKWSRSVMSDSLQPHSPGSSTHGIFQVRVLEWVAISFSTGSSQPRDRTWVSHIAGRHFTIWATREATKKRGRCGCMGRETNPGLLRGRREFYHWVTHDFLGGSDGEVSAYSAGDLGWIPGSGRSPGEGNGNPLPTPHPPIKRAQRNPELR